MKLPSNRRDFVAAVTGVVTLTWVSLWRPAMALQRTPQPVASPNAPKNPNVPGGLDTLQTEGAVKVVPSTINAAQLNAMVQQLYQMATELKQETDRVNLKNTLPVDFIRRAQQIEKLAKSLREKARG